MKITIAKIIQPQKIIYKIFEKIFFYYNLRKYNQNLFEEKQNNIFASLKLNRKKGIENLNSFLNTKNSMSSEHEVLFSSISINSNTSINNILEIGTYDGCNALLLSKLFPNSKIDTIDLSENDPDFINSYSRKNIIKKFIRKRNSNLSKNKNIKFSELNSLKLLNHKKKYDLIWIDGCHGYPIVCIDIINSLNLINQKGIIMCDDIYVNFNHFNYDKMYNSIASYETLNELQKNNLIKYKLIYKRLDPKNNCLPNKRKFVAIVNKIKN
jgi:predicted O-methyltransferase YrrM